MAGLGFGVDLVAARKVGARVAAAAIGALLFLSTGTLVVLKLVGIAD